MLNCRYRKVSAGSNPVPSARAKFADDLWVVFFLLSLVYPSKLALPKTTKQSRCDTANFGVVTDSHFKVGCEDREIVYCLALRPALFFRGILASLGLWPCASNPVPSASKEFCCDRDYLGRFFVMSARPVQAQRATPFFFREQAGRYGLRVK